MDIKLVGLVLIATGWPVVCCCFLLIHKEILSNKEITSKRVECPNCRDSFFIEGK